MVMVRCPMCGSEIEFLYYVERACRYFYRKFYIDDCGEGEYSDEEFYDDDVEDYYECPRCLRMVAYTEDGALRMLRGGE